MRTLIFRADILPSSSGLKYVRKGTDSVSLVSANKCTRQENTILRATMLFYGHLRDNEVAKCPTHLNLEEGGSKSLRNSVTIQKPQITSTVKTMAAHPSGMSVSAYWTIWCHNPEAQNHFNPEEGGSTSLRNVCTHILGYVVSQSRSKKSFQLWRRQYVPPKRRYTHTALYGVTIQKPKVTSTLKEAAYPSETSTDFQRTTGRCIAEDTTLQEIRRSAAMIESRSDTDSRLALTPAAAATNITNCRL